MPHAHVRSSSAAADDEPVQQDHHARPRAHSPVMKRITANPRADWEQTVESQGFLFHTGDEGQPYWDESAYYQFTRAEIDAIERATYALDEMCLQAVEYVVSEGRF